MRFLGFFIVSALLMNTSITIAQDLDKYQWKKRILILKEVDLNSGSLQDQLKRLQSNQKELDDRELLLFLVTDTSVYNAQKDLTALQPEAIIKKYGLINFKGLVLIGKDGGVKLKEKFVVNPSTIFELIDGMPMRLSEIKSKG